MDLSLFDYFFPKELVAQHPLPRREDSRMMVVERRAGRRKNQCFVDFPDHLKAGDLLVLNNAQADLIEMEGRLVPPLPPYIKRKKAEDFTEGDFERYRTVYASVPGSKAAPTAGFHFTEEMLGRIRSAGVEIRFVTLHVSHDTYKPIRTPNILDHPMHGEEYVVPDETAQAVQTAKKEGRRVIAVGTTTVRALESWEQNRQADTTRLFISPGYRFQIIDALLTNFHRPRSTVLVMVCALAGREPILDAYREAIDSNYRLFSYGDCMLII